MSADECARCGDPLPEPPGTITATWWGSGAVYAVCYDCFREINLSLGGVLDE